MTGWIGNDNNNNNDKKQEAEKMLASELVSLYGKGKERKKQKKSKIDDYGKDKFQAER